MNIILQKTNKLIPYHNNPRKNQAVDKVASSIKEFGWQQPIVVDESNVIVVGHTRYQAAKKLGLNEVPTHIAKDLTESQIKAYRLLDNRANQDALWDDEMLKIEIKGLEELDIDLKLTGFTDKELENLLFEEKQGLTDEDEVPDVPEEPVTKEGDLYILGNHRLLCGDSFIIKNVDFLLNGTKPDLLFTDPPYELGPAGGGILGKSNLMKQIKTNKVDKFNPLDLILFAETNIFFHNKPLIKQYIDLAEKNKKNYDLCFYKKENIAPNYGGHMMTDVEYIALIGKQNPNKGFQKEDYSKVFIGKKDLDNKLSYSKPVAICEKFIKLYSNSNILDLFTGSGSSLIAAERLNKLFFGMEKNPVFCDVIVKRWEDFTGNKAKRVSSS